MAAAAMFDRRGNPVSTASGAALDAAEAALWRMMSFYGPPLDDFDAASAADPGWLLPTLMKCGWLLSLTEPSVLVEAQRLLDAAGRQAHRAVDRERQHLVALERLAAGDWTGAADAWEQLLLRHPRDALALQWAHLFDFYRGDAAELRLRVARVLPEWDAGDALYPYVLGMHAFGLEENHLYDEAEAVGREALAGPARVPWAIHAVAHVMEMQGRHVDGSAWMAQWHDVWAVDNGFAGHLGWHDALFALERLDAGAALAAFDAHLAADPEQIDLQRLDAAALLWRVQLLDVDTGGRWQRLVDGWDLGAAGAGHYPFNDLHVLLALIGSGDLRRAERWCADAAGQAASRGGSPGEAARRAGVPLMRGLIHVAHGHFDAAVDALYQARPASRQLGGSHAQRDLIDQTLMAAAARTAAGSVQRAAGRALLNERCLAKPPTPLTLHWAERLGRDRLSFRGHLESTPATGKLR